MTKSEIGFLLATARSGAGMTQSELAAAMGTTQPAIARAEGGYRMPTLAFIDRWARATGSPLSITFGESPRRMPSAAKKRALVESVLGAGRFDPWDRNPSEVEAALLRRASRDPAYFRRLKRSGGPSRKPAQG